MDDVMVIVLFSSAISSEGFGKMRFEMILKTTLTIYFTMHSSIGVKRILKDL
jgi:hypothetical protein